MTEQYLRRPNTQCLECKKKIYRRPSEIEKRGDHVFCSSICYGKFCRKEIPCIVCGKKVLSGLNKKTCSRSCSNKNRTGLTYRNNQPNNKVTTLRMIKKRLFYLRGEKCERCKYNKPEVLQVHHKNRNTTDNDLENLEIICPNCHYEEHYL